MTTIRLGQAPAPLERAQFGARYRASFIDPAFRPEDGAIGRLEEIAWHAYLEGRKAPFTQKAGAGYADPDYDLSVEWIETRRRLEAAQQVWEDPATPSRVLLICGSARNEGTCHPCKACASTAMPPCHWPCSCYPNHGQNQTNDWMAEIYERWTAAHAVIIVTPVYWYQSPSPLKLMIDRLVCADGGNPDPTATGGKDGALAKKLEMAGWDYPQHLAGRVYGLVVHGDVAGIEGARRALSDWLDWMGFIDAGAQARLDRFIGYYEPYATSHDTLDRDLPMQEETRNVAHAVAKAVAELRAGRLAAAQPRTTRPRPK